MIYHDSDGNVFVRPSDENEETIEDREASDQNVSSGMVADFVVFDISSKSTLFLDDGDDFGSEAAAETPEPDQGIFDPDSDNVNQYDLSDDLMTQ